MYAIHKGIAAENHAIGPAIIIPVYPIIPGRV